MSRLFSFLLNKKIKYIGRYLDEFVAIFSAYSLKELDSNVIFHNELIICHFA